MQYASLLACGERIGTNPRTTSRTACSNDLDIYQPLLHSIWPKSEEPACSLSVVALGRYLFEGIDEAMTSQTQAEAAQRPRKRQKRAPDQQLSVSCQRCKSKKIKCDELEPRCGTCEKVDAECVLHDVQSGITISRRYVSQTSQSRSESYSASAIVSYESSKTRSSVWKSYLSIPALTCQPIRFQYRELAMRSPLARPWPAPPPRAFSESRAVLASSDTSSIRFESTIVDWYQQDSNNRVLIAGLFIVLLTICQT